MQRVGGFKDGIGRVGRTPLGCEETELSIRARAATGGRIVQMPDAKVEHRVSADRTRWLYFRRRCWAEGLSKAVAKIGLNVLLVPRLGIAAAGLATPRVSSRREVTP